MSASNDARMNRLGEVLEESKQLGFLGPGPVQAHLDHSITFVPWIENHSKIMDLGSGGGVPGLVIAFHHSNAHFTLVDANQRRCAFLADAITELGMDEHVEVVEGRAEDLARSETMRHRYDCVVARSFGPPAVVAECAVGFLELDGVLVVSEPPNGSEDRWDRAGLDLLGLTVIDTVRDGSAGLQILAATSLCDERYPRRNGIPAKRPLF